MHASFLPIRGEADKVLDAIQAWAQNVQKAEAPDAEELSRVVEELLQQESSYAEQNAKRFRLVSEAFHQKDFEVIVNIVDLLMAPLDAATNQLLKRSATLKDLRFWTPECQKTIEELKAECRDFFLDYQNGNFGAKIVADLTKQMQTGQLASYCESCADVSMFHTCFELMVFEMSDTWRRFCLAMESFPHRLWSLATCHQQEFVETWGQLRDMLRTCPDCFDSAFSRPLLQSADMANLSHADRVVFAQGVQNLLCDLATFCPLGTDLVENLHGQHQNQLTRFRGKTKGPQAAAECSVLAGLVNEHAFLKSTIMEEAMPSHFVVAAIQKQLGRKKGVLPKKNRKTRMLLAANKRRRSMSAWNVFQRERLMEHSSGGGSLSKAEYTAIQKECSQEWRRMPAKDKSSILAKKIGYPDPQIRW